MGFSGIFPRHLECGKFLSHSPLYFLGLENYRRIILSEALRAIGATGLIGRFAPLPGLRPSSIAGLSPLGIMR